MFKHCGGGAVAGRGGRPAARQPGGRSAGCYCGAAHRLHPQHHIRSDQGVEWEREKEDDENKMKQVALLSSKTYCVYWCIYSVSPLLSGAVPAEVPSAGVPAHRAGLAGGAVLPRPERHPGGRDGAATPLTACKHVLCVICGWLLCTVFYCCRSPSAGHNSLQRRKSVHWALLCSCRSCSGGTAFVTGEPVKACQSAQQIDGLMV